MASIPGPPNVKSDLSAEVDITPWFQQLTTELDAALADMAHTMASIQDGSYAEKANGQRFGLIEVKFSPDATSRSKRAIDRAAEACFRSTIGRFISFLDKLIASDLLSQEGIVADCDLSSPGEIHAYLNAYLAKKIAVVAGDTKLSNPKKLARFEDLADFSRRAVLGYFALRRCIEHHQGIAQEDIQFCVLRQKLFVDDAEVLELPAPVREGQTVQVRLVPEEKTFAWGTEVVLSPEDVHAIVLTLRVAIAPEIFKLHVEALQHRAVGASANRVERIDRRRAFPKGARQYRGQVRLP